MTILFTSVRHARGDVLAMVQFVAPDSAQGAAMDDLNNSLIAQEDSMQHSNPHIQQDLDLWERIKDYDQCSLENPFVLVLSKKQKEMLKKHQFDGKAPYWTCSTGKTSPPPAQ